MIVAGIGSRKGVAAGEVLAAIDAALGAHALSRADLSGLATMAIKKDEAGIFGAAEVLGLGVTVIDADAALSPRSSEAPPPLTRSLLSQAFAGTPSVSESAALAAAGPGAKLLGPRIVSDRVTCALAHSGDAP